MYLLLIKTYLLLRLFYIFKIKVFTKGILSKIGIFAPSKLPNNPSWSLINFNFLLLHTVNTVNSARLFYQNVDKSIIVPFFCFYNFRIFTLHIFSTLQTTRQHCFIYTLSFYLLL